VPIADQIPEVLGYRIAVAEVVVAGEQAVEEPYPLSYAARRSVWWALAGSVDYRFPCWHLDSLWA